VGNVMLSARGMIEKPFLYGQDRSRGDLID
jgi:hypothetical protein